MATEVVEAALAAAAATVVTGPALATEDAPSIGLSFAIAALRRDLSASAAGSGGTDLAQTDHDKELASALAALEATYAGTVVGLPGATAEAERSAGHLERVCRFAMMLTALVAPEHAADPQFEYGYLLHDIGKLMVPTGVLTNPGALSDREWELMKQHPEGGRSLLAGIPFFSDACQIVHAHHERWDGKGYPRGLAGNDIPVGARILALCDAFNAMTQDRPYRKASSITDARGEIHRGGGRQFWPAAVDAFLRLPVPALEAVVRRPPPRDPDILGSASRRPPPNVGPASPPQAQVARPLGRLARLFAKRRSAPGSHLAATPIYSR